MLNVLLNLLIAYLNNNSRSLSPQDQIGHVVGDVAERGKDLVMAALLWFLASLFVFASFVIFCIEVGLQIDKGIYFSCSGLVISSLILFAIAFVLVFVGWLVSRKKETKEPTPPPKDPADELKSALYDLALSFLQEFKENRDKTHSKN